MQKSLLSRAVNQPSREGCWAMALPPRSPAEDGHRGGCPWRPRLSNAVSMMPKNDWFHGSGQCSLTAQGESRLHLGEETLAACEMLLNRVIARVIVWPVTPPPLPRRQGIYSQASCYMLRILGLNLSFVWAWVIVSVCFLWGCGESADNNVLVWKVKQQGHRSWQLTLLWIVFCH